MNFSTQFEKPRYVNHSLQSPSRKQLMGGGEERRPLGRTDSAGGEMALQVAASPRLLSAPVVPERHSSPDTHSEPSFSEGTRTSVSAWKPSVTYKCFINDLHL